MLLNQDGFTLEELTASINNVPVTPGIIAGLGLFEEEGISTLTAQIEQSNGKISLVASAPRGGVGQTLDEEKRNLRPVNAIHLPQSGSLLADSVQGVRVFGSGDQSTALIAKRDKELARMRKNIDATIEYHRMGAIKGMIVDADGTELLDLYDLFEISQQTQAMGFSSEATVVRKKILSAKRKYEDALGSSVVSDSVAFCGSGFFDALTDHSDVIESYKRFNEGSVNRGDNRKYFSYGGVVFVEYRASVGSTNFLPANEARLVPMGVPDLFKTWFAPADYNETVNTIGLPYYSKAEPKKFGKGFDLEAQSNPINLCTRPGAVIKLTM